MSQTEKPKPLKEKTTFKDTPESTPPSSDHEDEGWKSRKSRKKNKAKSKSSKSLSSVPDSENVDMIDTSSDRKKKPYGKLSH